MKPTGSAQKRGPMTGSGVIRHLGDQDGGSRSALRTGARARTCPTGNLRTPPMHKLPVVPICRMHFGLLRRANQNHARAYPASMKRDVSADRHDMWGGDAMDADGTSDERG
jgi:hypothetical protein